MSKVPTEAVVLSIFLRIKSDMDTVIETHASTTKSPAASVSPASISPKRPKRLFFITNVVEWKNESAPEVDKALIICSDVSIRV